jgi:hypothetical protein
MMGCKGLPRVFISNEKKGKEIKIAKRQKESVRVMQSIVARGR